MKKLIYPMVLLAACIGCTANLPDDSETGPYLQLLSVGIPENTETKATVTTQSIKEVQTYVTKADVGDSQGTDYWGTTDSKPTTAKFTNGDDGWSTTAPIEIANTQGTAWINACYPANAIVNDNKVLKTAVTIRSSQGFGSSSDTNQQVDYLYSDKANASSTNRAITLKMRHALAKVSFRVDKSNSVSEEMTLTRIDILSRSSLLQKGDGSMLLADGTLNGLTTTDSMKLEGSTVLAIQQSTPNVSCMVAPMNAIESVLSFALTVKVGSVSRTFSTASVPSVKWEKGNHYTYHITINKMGGSLTDVTIDKWKNDASPNTSIGI